MVRRCSYGLCNSDDRYPERLAGGIKFVPFPKPKTNYEKCIWWIKLCGRPHEQLNTSKIDKNRFICTKHFVDQKLPTAEFPDPLPADRPCQPPTPARKPPKKRCLGLDSQKISTDNVQRINTSVPNCFNEVNRLEINIEVEHGLTETKETQTCSMWADPADLMAMVVENEGLKRDLSKCSLQKVEDERKLKEYEDKKTTKELNTVDFKIETIIENNKLIHYYTGFSKQAFCLIFSLLVPDANICPLNYVGKGKLSQIQMLLLQNQVFLTLCKLRNDLDLQDLAFRFGVTQQVAGVIFNSWINYMFLRFGEISIWPHRDVLYEHMPEDYKSEFPNTFVIVDCTEIRTQKPSSLKAQSQTYSDYKSTNTLKSLVAVDPRGSVIFSSMLFSGSMSDKEVFKQTGFQSQLQNLMRMDYLNEGDGIMADKGFDIQKEVRDIGLQLNIPPFAKSGFQMNQHDVYLTQKIAKHRVHVERAIRRIKSFKILNGRIPVSMLSAVDQIWFVCSFLTNFMPPCIRKK